MKYYEKKSPEPHLTETFVKRGDLELIVDIFLPEGKIQNGGGVLCVHGGGWSGGNRDSFLWHAHRLSLHGYVACTFDYRLTDTAIFPAALEDCQMAVAWFRKNADRFKIDPSKIGVMGSSAGGHLVACLGVFEKEIDAVSAKANCVVDIHGIHDFISLSQCSGKPHESRKSFLGGEYADVPDAWFEASPALHANKDTSPMFIVHDPFENVVPYDQSVVLANALMRYHRHVHFIPSPGSGHGFFYNPEKKWTQTIWPHVVSWLDVQFFGVDDKTLIEEID